MVRFVYYITFIFSACYLSLSSLLSARDAWKPALVSTRTDSGSPDIYLAVDGQLRQLTTDPAYDIQPALSANGKWIVFVSNRDGNYELYRMKTDGSDLKRLTSHPAVDEQPRWIGSSQLIEFISERDGVRCYYQIDLNGEGLQKRASASFDQRRADLVEVPTLPYQGGFVIFLTFLGLVISAKGLSLRLNR